MPGGLAASAAMAGATAAAMGTSQLVLSRFPPPASKAAAAADAAAAVKAAAAAASGAAAQAAGGTGQVAGTASGAITSGAGVTEREAAGEAPLAHVAAAGAGGSAAAAVGADGGTAPLAGAGTGVIDQQSTGGSGLAGTGVIAPSHEAAAPASSVAGTGDGAPVAEAAAEAAGMRVVAARDMQLLALGRRLIPGCPDTLSWGSQDGSAGVQEQEVSSGASDAADRVLSTAGVPAPLAAERRAGPGAGARGSGEQGGAGMSGVQQAGAAAARRSGRRRSLAGGASGAEAAARGRHGSGDAGVPVVEEAAVPREPKLEGAARRRRAPRGALSKEDEDAFWNGDWGAPSEGGRGVASEAPGASANGAKSEAAAEHLLAAQD